MVRVAGGRVVAAVLTGFGISDRPVSRDVTDLVATWDDEETLRAALAELADDMVDKAGDAHGSRGYRARLLATLGAAQLVRARQAAAGGG